MTSRAFVMLEVQHAVSLAGVDQLSPEPFDYFRDKFAIQSCHWSRMVMRVIPDREGRDSLVIEDGHPPGHSHAEPELSREQYPARLVACNLRGSKRSRCSRMRGRLEPTTRVQPS